MFLFRSEIHHISKYFYQQNRKRTIKRKSHDGGKCKLGQRKGFSETDVKKINTLYDCPGFPHTTGGTGSTKPKPTEAVPTVVPDLSCKDTNQ